MSKRLGTPYKRGKSDVIDSFKPYNGIAVAEGLAVTKHTDGTIKAVSSASDIVLGVAGLIEHKNQSLVRAGLEVYVQLVAGITPIIGGAVYVEPSTGKFTTEASNGEGESAVSNIAVNATFAGAKETCVNSKGESFDAVSIDFPGGL